MRPLDESGGVIACGRGDGRDSLEMKVRVFRGCVSVRVGVLQYLLPLIVPGIVVWYVVLSMRQKVSSVAVQVVASSRRNQKSAVDSNPSPQVRVVSRSKKYKVRM